MADYLLNPYHLQVASFAFVNVILGISIYLTLATGQRFASKGGYLVQFSGKQGTHVTAEHAWLVP